MILWLFLYADPLYNLWGTTREGWSNVHLTFHAYVIFFSSLSPRLNLYIWLEVTAEHAYRYVPRPQTASSTNIVWKRDKWLESNIRGPWKGTALFVERPALVERVEVVAMVGEPLLWGWFTSAAKTCTTPFTVASPRGCPTLYSYKSL